MVGVRANLLQNLQSGKWDTLFRDDTICLTSTLKLACFFTGMTRMSFDPLQTMPLAASLNGCVYVDRCSVPAQLQEHAYGAWQCEFNVFFLQAPCGRLANIDLSLTQNISRSHLCSNRCTAEALVPDSVLMPEIVLSFASLPVPYCLTPPAAPQREHVMQRHG